MELPKDNNAVNIENGLEPMGDMEMSDAELETIVGGTSTGQICNELVDGMNGILKAMC